MGHHDYANPSALVEADWAQEHLSDPSVRFVEVDVDTTAYEQSHLRGAVGWNWTSQLADGILLILLPWEIIVARICFVFATKIQERRQLEPRLNRRLRDQLRYRQHLRLSGVLIESCVGDDAVGSS